MSIRGSVTTLRPPDLPGGDAFAHRIRRHLGRLARSAQFNASARSREFLAFVVDEALAGRGAQLNQSSIATAVFGRKADFDAILDPIVRVQAGRLRRSLERYYLLTGESDAIRIELPKGSYAPVFREAKPRDHAAHAVAPTFAAADESDWPAILIHAVAIGCPEDSELAVQAGDELTRELYRLSDLRVVCEGDAHGVRAPKPASVRFELLGVLRRAEDRRLLSARLIDRACGQQIWSDEFDAGPASDGWTASLADIPRIIAARIGAEQGVIGRVLAGEHATRRRDGSNGCSAVAAYHHVLFSREVAGLAPTIEALHRLVARAPETGAGWTYLARLYLMNHAFELSALRTPIAQALKFAYQAVLLDPANARARCVLATALLVGDELRAARDELEQALRLNPYSLAHRESIGWLLALAGDWQHGMRVMHDAMQRNPYCQSHVNHGLWADHLRRGEIEAAHVAALGYLDSGFFWRALMISCSLGHLGRPSEAQASVTELLQAKPQFPERGRTLIGHLIKPLELRETVIEGLRKAGLELAS
jgi:adenylate cyclase